MLGSRSFHGDHSDAEIAVWSQHHLSSTFCISSHGTARPSQAHPVGTSCSTDYDAHCLYQYHIAAVSQRVPPQIKNRHSTCFFKEQEPDHLDQHCVPLQFLNDSSSQTLPSKPLLLANERCAGRQKALLLSHS